MGKLLSANFTRLWKNIPHWLCMVFMTAGSFVFSWMTYNTALRGSTDPIYMEDLLFNLFPMMGFVCAFFICLYLGTEFDDNTIRNKLIVGHTRRDVFFANYFTCMAVSLMQLFAMLLVSGAAGWLFFRQTLLGWQEIAFLVLCSILCTMVFSAICVGIAMNTHRKATAIVVTLLFMLCILYLASYMESALLETEMTYDSITITMDGVQYGDLVPNPAYVDGNARVVMEFVYDLLPTGQAIQLNNMAFERCLRWPWLSVIMLAVSTVLGCLPFRKRDIR